MLKDIKKSHKFYGTTTLGERGQAVIPAEARKAMSLEKGEKLLVFGLGEETLMFSKLSDLEQIASHLTSNLEMIREIIKKNK